MKGNISKKEHSKNEFKTINIPYSPSHHPIAFYELQKMHGQNSSDRPETSEFYSFLCHCHAK